MQIHEPSPWKAEPDDGRDGQNNFITNLIKERKDECRTNHKGRPEEP